MDRPGSRAESARPTGLKQPTSRLPMAHQNGRALLETSLSEINAKTSRDTAAMPPPISSSKHKIPGLSESVPKQRKTLAERAGEPYSQNRMQPVQRPGKPINGHFARGSVSKLAAQTSQIARPTSAQNGLYKPGTRQLYKLDLDADDEDEDYTLGRRKGTPILSLSPQYRNINLRKNKRLALPESQHSGIPPTPTVPLSRTPVPSQKETHVAPIMTAAQRQWSLSTRMAALTITPCKTSAHATKEEGLCGHEKDDVTRGQASPSKMPSQHTFEATPSVDTSSNLLARRKEHMPVFLTKEHTTPYNPERTLIQTTELDTRARLEAMDKQYMTMQSQFSAQVDESAAARLALEDALAMWKTRVEELQQANRSLAQEKAMAFGDLDRARQDLQTTITDLHQSKLDHERSQADAEKRHSRELHEARLLHEKQMQSIERAGERAVGDLEKEVREMKSSLEKEKNDELSNLQNDHWEEVESLRKQHEEVLFKMRQDLERMKKSDEGRAVESASQIQVLRECIKTLEGQVEASHVTSDALRTQIAAAEARTSALETERNNLVSKAHFLEGNQEAQSQEFTNMSRRLQEAESIAAAATEQLRKEETVRRRLNAQILELKGNIRVFARIRPLLEREEQPTRVEYPDDDQLDGKKQLVVHAPTTFTATGKERNEKFDFSFDRVYAPDATNHDVFEDCRDLVQSVVDGYNVSILSYGQTGSGKTYGMSGIDGIIPSSISLLLAEIDRLRGKGWEYRVEASFIEVYNDTLNDLLGDAKAWDNDDEIKTRSRARHEIHHDAVTGKTSVTNLTSSLLWPPPDAGDSTRYTEETIERILETATRNRRVAATKANERSSRSHSVFMLTLHGTCDATSESSEGVLNLVDLAGSERLKHSGAEGVRAKETAAINTSLKSLGDVIEKIGSGGHVPYRNSKLTYLLQSSLGGATNGKHSRTLLLLHLSPLQAHWQETKTSLQFGVKVHGTIIGTAKKR